MKRLRKHTAALLVACLLLLNAAAAVSAQSADEATRQYDVSFSVLKDGTDTVSAMDEYTQKPAKIAVENGQVYILLTLLKSSWVTGFEVEQNGELAAPEEVSADAAADTKTVRFPAGDLTAKTNAHITVEVPAMNYKGDYKVQLKFDTTGMPGASSSHGGAPTGTVSEGTYSNGTVTQGTYSTGEQPGAGHVQAGPYPIAFTILKDGTEEVSSMANYTDKTAQLTVQDGVYHIAFTLKSSSLIPNVQYEHDGAYVDAAVVSTDAAADSRVLDIVVGDLAGKTNVALEVNAGPRGTMKHTVQFKFDLASVGGGSHGAGNGQGQGNGASNGGMPTDIASHWAYASIAQAVGRGIVAGYEDNTFRPDGNITRAEFAVMLAKALKLQGEAKAPSAFADAGSIPDWAAASVALAGEAGLVSGYEDNTFRADGLINRAELAVIIARAAGLSAEEQADSTFADAASIPAWAKGAVSASVQAGFIAGRDGNQFAPAEHATRAEAITLLLKVVNQPKK
ncbi:MAG: NEAT domain-containing protein [Paenibacillaceae bacterium]|nr:NEAT domain-containing protein [Paenibacillaceae bacterium]